MAADDVREPPCTDQCGNDLIQVRGVTQYAHDVMLKHLGYCPWCQQLATKLDLVHEHGAHKTSDRKARRW